MKRVPRILKINKVRYPQIYCVFRNGEYRKINIRSLFKKLKIEKGDFGFKILNDEQLFNSVVLKNFTLAWPKLKKTISILKGKKKSFYFDLDSVVLMANSVLDQRYSGSFDLGKLLKARRKGYGLTQGVLADSIGTNKQYISRIENNASDLEYKTLRKIVEVGFNQYMCVGFYDENDAITTFSNSILTKHFTDWITSNKIHLTLIEGLGPKVEEVLQKANINSVKDLAKMEFNDLYDILKSETEVKGYRSPESWIIQATYIIAEDWVNLVKLQRLLNSKSNKPSNSKLEVLAKKDIKEDLYVI